jgi:FixJ family two-component response regulator
LIAVVDDDESFRTALVESLASLGYKARGFGSGEEFIAAGAQGSCDCLITDIQMPGMSGFELRRLLIAQSCRMPVIMITARTEPDLESRAAASGAVGLLRKPFSSGALMDCLERALSRRAGDA